MTNTTDDVMFQGKWIATTSGIQSLTPRVCGAAVAANSRLSSITDKALQKVHIKHHDTLRHVVGFLYLDGMLDATALVARGKQSRKQRRGFIEKQREESLLRLQEAGILPVAPPWFSIAWFVLRWIVLPFLQEVLDQYAAE